SVCTWQMTRLPGANGKQARFPAVFPGNEDGISTSSKNRMYNLFYNKKNKIMYAENTPYAGIPSMSFYLPNLLLQIVNSLQKPLILQSFYGYKLFVFNKLI
ncbi:MAG: hypothetical protein LIP08_10715, partial [Bacteroides sp.]|nr:hypothetical protein [Bacteroides sp.]